MPNNFQFASRIKESSTTAGTVALQLGGAFAGFQTFVAGIGDGGQCRYFATHDTVAGEWEHGYGTVTAGSPDSLTRNPIESSNSGALVNFSAGDKTVFVDSVQAYRLTEGINPPPSTGWTQGNFAGATETHEQIEGVNRMVLESPDNGAAHDLRSLVVTAPAAPYTFRARIRANMIDGDNVSCGLVGIETGSPIVNQKHCTFGRVNGTTLAIAARVTRWSDAESFSATPFASSLNGGGGPDSWWQIRDDGALRHYEYSRDGVSWVDLYSEGRTDYLEFERIGVYVNAYDADALIVVDSWEVL